MRQKRKAGRHNHDRAQCLPTQQALWRQLKDVSFDISGAEMIGLIGPNGAGKTTLTNVLDGAIKPNSGTVYLNGTRIDQLPSFEVAKAGLGRTFQVTRSFRRMTVLENLYVPAMAQGRRAPKYKKKRLRYWSF